MKSKKLKPIRSTLTYENDDISILPQFQSKGYRTTPLLHINGQRVPDHQAAKARPDMTLLSFLREVMGLTGSKLGCAEGGCGACTVMISRFDENGSGSGIGHGDNAKGGVVHYSVNACLMPVLAADGVHITTVEGIGSVKKNLNGANSTLTSTRSSNDDNMHPIQKAMVDFHGSQCGFCTPGIVVAIYSLFANNSSQKYMEEHLDGNLCRCTGYRPIWDAARSLCTEDNIVKGPCGTACRDCPEREVCDMDCNVEDLANEEKEEDFKASTSATALEEKKDPEETQTHTDSTQSLCCSSTADKIAQSKQSNQSQTWLDQPNNLFPKELLSPPTSPLIVVDRTFHKAGTWIQPTTLKEFLWLLKEYSGECKIVVGNTEVGIETKFKHAVFPKIISPSQSISSLFKITADSTGMNPGLSIGSCTPLSAIQHQCGEWIGGEWDRIAKPIHDMLRWFASTQIRNVACLGGNLVTASPISDMNPMLASLGATLVIAKQSNDGDGIDRREVPVSEFFLTYRKVDLKPEELVEAIHVPKPKFFEYVFPFKQARRREDDISIVTSGMRILLKPDVEDGVSVFKISNASLAFGGMAPTTKMATKTMEFLVGSVFSKETFEAARSVLQIELDLPDHVPGGQAQYRKALASSFLYKFYFNIVKALSDDLVSIAKGGSGGAFPDYDTLPPAPIIADDEIGALDSFISEEKPSTSGVQKFPPPKSYDGLESRGKYAGEAMAVKAMDSVGKKDAVGQPSTHASGPLHCTGEALYTDDIPLVPGSLHATLIMASTCNVELLSVDASVALDTPGVIAVYTHEDVVRLGGDNTMGPVVHDEFLFLPIGERVGFVGQVIGVCIGESLECSEAGARSVKIAYGETNETPIVSIEDAIEANSFYEYARHVIDRFDEVTIRDDDEVVVVEGSFRCGGQEHFYLETNSTLAVPNDAATNLTIYTSTQAVTKTQMYCASTTNTPASKVVVRMKRMGGGFGGKETRSVFASCAASVAAKLSGRPVRLTLSRDADMSITGGRHAFLANYKASAVLHSDKTVKLKSLDIELFNNGGSGFDLSGPVMDRALFHVDGPYFWPQFHAVGVPCKTVQPPHTAFRGFGGPQGLAACEHVIDQLATACGISGDQLREQNMYTDGDQAPFGMVMGKESGGQWNVPKMWQRLRNESDYAARRIAIDEFNSKNRFKKRGISLLPTKFGIAFTAKFMNQGGALVHLYTDGTVLVSHGGTEMGQGLHTKVCQIAAQAFNIPLEDVYVNDTSSDKVANTIPSAASMSTDMYGMATLDACRQILKRIEALRNKFPEGTPLKNIASEAFMERIDLSAHGFFTLDDSRCGYDWNTEKPDEYPDNLPQNSWKGQPFNYFTQGCALTEVEIDVLTGNHRTIQSDLIVDVGRSINPALDIGQIEGAFIQGMGWATIEELVYGDKDHTWIRPQGRMFTTGPGTYKIPAFNDVPEKFNVALMEDIDNPFAVHSSKAIGEPPFFLGASVFYAIKEAVKSARLDSDIDGYFEMRMPATSERIRLACADKIAEECVGEDMKTFQPKGSH